MEYQFTHTVHGVLAKCSMEHEAFAHWLNIEIIPNPEKIPAILDEVKHCRTNLNGESVFEGKEYSLYLSNDEVVAKSNQVDFPFEEFDEMENGFHVYEDESIAFCGLEDFEAFLQAYLRFVKNYH
ncbi:hypothetical protein EV693_10378 [Nicoletella semolina]|uniref:Uncharacterized protein n=1 Tax=Nicoletella semolina TaxID=271160 RepID=A0A4R2NAZ0_9PAST|nr:YacL family protein [Nicoletella semolina]MDH2923978.1 hypothetical protein [Nicoletella semolina]TCP18112.1 hypothetical protein EV693_10378 [Nicoletella semolina]